ncbi:hypothetical protein K435DRAFT_935072 [Dendrothele bispora CBS 962.96]|uniref:Uncharacterized protein n=1 Tax=Dendrothele bispora (strain CBS 962.96) TaxID=1314807 RepID=A0A4S8L0V7_DENBC|nr:hypothetical protein K435DRAFT_935072 [Dendrothele bispora CBS 962.96]
MAVGSGLMSLSDPYRGGEYLMIYVLSYMISALPQPRINIKTIDMNALSNMSEGTFGCTYVS